MGASVLVGDAAAGAAPPPLTLVNGDGASAPETWNAGKAAEGGVGECGGAVAGVGGADVERLRHRVDEIISKVDELQLEQRVNEVTCFCSSKKQPDSVAKEKGKEKPAATCQKKLVDVPRREVVCSKRMQELMRQFATIMRQILQHKWAWPFMEPVDVEGLRLHDYYEVIKKPMDFGTIRNKMEAKDSSGYKNVRDIYADVRLIFKNAMTYTVKGGGDVHVMAQTLLDKFEEKWLQLLPKVIEEETRQKEEEANAHADMLIAQEAAMVKMARDTDAELSELTLHLEELRETVIQKCRKMTTEEKRKLGVGLSRLSTEDLNKALEIIAQNNPSFQATAEEVDLDMDVQSESTLWRLKFFVKEALKVQAMRSPTKSKENSKRKMEICHALAKTAKKRSKKNR